MVESFKIFAAFDTKEHLFESSDFTMSLHIVTLDDILEGITEFLFGEGMETS